MSEPRFKNKVCPNCGAVNSYTVSNCLACGVLLNGR